MTEVRIMLDFIFGPIWKDYFDPDEKEWGTGVTIVDKDEILKEINDRISELYLSYHEIDEYGVPTGFDYEREKADKELMLTLLRQLNERLAQLNDGSFYVVDKETPRVMAL